MAITKTALANAVAEELGIKKANQTLAAADAETIKSRIDGVRGFLLTEGLCHWDADSIPDDVREPLIMIVGTRAAPSFGVKYDAGQAGLTLLRSVVSRKASKEPTTAEYL